MEQQPRQQPDELLLAAFARGNEEAIQMVLARYKKPVFNFALRLLANRADAEDVTSEVFIALLGGRYSSQAQAKFSTWLFTVARNTCLTKIRQRKKIQFLWFKDRQTGQEGYLDCEDPTARASELLQQQEQTAYLKAAIARLPVEQREALILRAYQEMPYVEIAQVLGCSLEKVKVLIFRARQRLRQGEASDQGGCHGA